MSLLFLIENDDEKQKQQSKKARYSLEANSLEEICLITVTRNEDDENKVIKILKMVQF